MERKEKNIKKEKDINKEEKAKTKIQIIVIVILIIILSILAIYTVKEINKNAQNIESQNSPFDFNMNKENKESKEITYQSNNEITQDETISNREFESNIENENAILVNGKINVELDNVTVNKQGDSDGGDDTSFYGINSAILAKSGATLEIKDSTINTEATGANGVFAFGGSATTNNEATDETTINITNSTITTKKDNSGGIMVTGGGILNAFNLNVLTSGISSAAIRSDRGGGTLNVDGGTYITTGKGSPAIYSTANVTVKNATLKSESSEGAIIEGKNSITLENVELEDTNNALNGMSTTFKNIFIYQSMSGDASVGTAQFKAKKSRINTNQGDSIYVTNTKASIYLNDCIFINNDIASNFLRIQKDSWGKEGSNGGEVELVLDEQNIEGNIVVDELSTLNIEMKNNSYILGEINKDNTAKNIVLKIDRTSILSLTGDTYVSNLENEKPNYSNIEFNGYNLYVNGEKINH